MPSPERPHGAPPPPEAAARTRRLKYFLWTVAALIVIGLIMDGPAVLSGHPTRLLEYAGAIVALGTGQVIVAALASRRARRWRRWHYLLLSLGFLIAAVGLGLTAGWAARHHNALSAILAGAAIFASTGALLAAARGSLRGRLRRAMWRYPPPWLDTPAAKPAESHPK